MKETKYPTCYEHLSKREFLMTDSKDSACIIFVPNDKGCDRQLDQAVIKHARQSKKVLVLAISDLGLTIGNKKFRPQLNHLNQIDDFLQENRQSPIIAVCDAGVSRSGFISFYLDLKNKSWSHIQGQIDEFTKEFIVTRPRRQFRKAYMTNPGLSTLLLQHPHLLTPTELNFLKSLL